MDVDEAVVDQSGSEEILFESYIPPSRDAITLPNYIIYLLLASSGALIALYAIIRHLIKDLLHDLAGNNLTTRDHPISQKTIQILSSSQAK